MTKKELADVLGLKPRQIDNLVVDGLPRRKVGREWDYGPNAIVWYFTRKIERLEAQKPPSLDEARARREMAQAELAEYELKVRRGEMLTVADHERLLADVLARVRARLLNTPGKYAPQHVGLRTIAEAQLRLEEAVGDVMAELARIGDEIEDAPTETPANPPKRAARSTPPRRRRRAKAARAAA